MNLVEWQLASGAYMPSLDDRLEIAIANLLPDPFGRVPGWFAAYALIRYFSMASS